MCVYSRVVFACDHAVWGKRLKPCVVADSYAAGDIPTDCVYKSAHGLKSRTVPRPCNSCYRLDSVVTRLHLKLEDCRRAFAEKWPEYDLYELRRSLSRSMPENSDKIMEMANDVSASSDMIEDITEAVLAHKSTPGEAFLTRREPEPPEPPNTSSSTTTLVHVETQTDPELCLPAYDTSHNISSSGARHEAVSVHCGPEFHRSEAREETCNDSHSVRGSSQNTKTEYKETKTAPRSSRLAIPVPKQRSERQPNPKPVSKLPKPGFHLK